MQLKKCTLCGEYTMQDVCRCGGKAITVKPPRYSPLDKYGTYRRALKFKDRANLNE
ncbi:H/ACA ribonucleoprotein complex subunit 3 [Methanococcus voltae]|uniref:RNA-protein complex protein Nop10 n=1 Tax=Methanococcus voltae TaxID=2188 RepID=UPI001AE4695B|nr:RNA-protein complex protein Nop10 [Methanococcus voltae]MBP2143284.1 H/ACA ribonucleoprotein complex subunit 3 [Methanococcus voltae]